MMPLQAGFLDAAGVLEFANLKSLRDFNMTYEELATPTASGIIHVDDLAVTRKMVTSLLTTGEWLDQQMRFLYPDGAYRWTRARVFPWRDAQGNIVRYYSAGQKRLIATGASWGQGEPFVCGERRPPMN